MSATIQQSAPPLIQGDNLTREEFLRRWEGEPEVRKAELIGGVVYMPSPVSVEHGDKDGNTGTWLGVYAAYTPGCVAGHNSTTLLLKDAPQPDQNLRISPECGGKSWIQGNFLAGSPELLAEISLSSAAYDLHQKLDLFQAAGVQEYLAILLKEQEIRWQVLRDGVYQILPPGQDGIWRSQVFPGLWLDGAALFRGDMHQVLAVLQRGMATSEHQAFVAKLKAP